SNMDFATRDRYRHVIERISKRTKKSEPEIASIALRMAQEAHDQIWSAPAARSGDGALHNGLSAGSAEQSKAPSPLRSGALQSEDTSRAHVGYSLVGEGLLRLESEVGYRPRLSEQILRAVERHPALAYLGTFTAV